VRRWIPDRHELAKSQWLKPFAKHLENDSLWVSNRTTVERAVGIGLFFGFLLPIGQFLFAIAAAVLMRAHLGIAAASTLVTNPLTFGPVYWLAYQLGLRLTGAGPLPADGTAVAAATGSALKQAESVTTFANAAAAAGWPLAVGLVTFALCGALVGPLLVRLLWRKQA
jgi:uncharacterized protein